MIVENVRALCKENNTSIWALERNLGIGNGVIARWKNSSPRVETVQAVANYFGVTVDDLLRDTEQDSA